MGQLGFFDADKRLEALSAKGDPLEAIDRRLGELSRRDRGSGAHAGRVQEEQRRPEAVRCHPDVQDAGPASALFEVPISLVMTPMLFRDGKFGLVVCLLGSPSRACPCSGMSSSVRSILGKQGHQPANECLSTLDSIEQALIRHGVIAFSTPKPGVRLL